MSDFNARYAHITETEKKVEITLTKEQMAAILYAYDYGLKKMDEEPIQVLDSVIDVLKDQIWP